MISQTLLHSDQPTDLQAKAKIYIKGMNLQLAEQGLRKRQGTFLKHWAHKLGGDCSYSSLSLTRHSIRTAHLHLSNNVPDSPAEEHLQGTTPHWDAPHTSAEGLSLTKKTLPHPECFLVFMFDPMLPTYTMPMYNFPSDSWTCHIVSSHQAPTQTVSIMQMGSPALCPSRSHIHAIPLSIPTATPTTLQAFLWTPLYPYMFLTYQ